VETFSDPSEFADNIIWQNRQFFFFVDTSSGCTPGDPACVSNYGLCPDIGGTIPGLVCPGGNTPVYDDLAVIGTAGTLACDPLGSCILTGGSDPLFVNEYVNGDKSSVLQPEINTAIETPPAFDEGGNFIRPRYGPLALYDDDTPDNGDPGILFGDYHILAGSPAVDTGTDLTGTYPDLDFDFDGDARPSNGSVDIGADELIGAFASATNTVTINRVSYFPFFRILLVTATSDVPFRSVSLTAHWNDAVQTYHETLTPLLGGHILFFGASGSPEGEVVVTSSGGSAASAPVPFP
jgi:hypothetical protein